MEKYNCPYCKKTILENNQNNISNDLIIKSKLVFLNEDGNILAKCTCCKKIIALPLDFSKQKMQITTQKIIDL